MNEHARHPEGQRGMKMRLLYLALGLVVGLAGAGAIQSVVAVPPQHPSTWCVASTAPLTFRDPPVEHQPFQDWVGQNIGFGGPATAMPPAGVVQPGGTAVSGIRAFESGDRAAAEQAAETLLSIATPEMMFPYAFDDPQYDLKAPWTSMYAQGLALILFTDLGRPEAAMIAKTIQPDGKGWFQEYPGPVTVLNGHIFATLALWTYWRATGDKDAEARALAGVEVARRNVHSFFTDSQIYLNTVGLPVAGYYWMVYLDQWDWLWAITGEPCFAAVDQEVYRQWFDH